MLTRGKTSKFRAVKYLVVVVALLAVLAMCLTSCGAAVKDVKYVDGSLTKSVYDEGEIFDCTGAKITVTYDDGTTATVDVTPTMTGEVVLRGVGTRDIAVSYTEDNVTYTAYIPVTVKNPVKDAAVAALNDNAAVKANPTDKGIVKLLDAYTALIRNAATDAVEGLKNEFATSVATYVAAKEACDETLKDLTLLDNLYVQYQAKALVEMNNALVLFNQATDAAAFDEIKGAYLEAIKKLEEDQKFYEGEENGDLGQIEDKIAILNIIKNAKANVSARLEELNAVLASGEIAPDSQDFITLKIADLKNSIAKFDYYYEYVTLAINLGNVQDKVEALEAASLTTPLDDIYEILCDINRVIDAEKGEISLTEKVVDEADGITVIPAPYANGTLGDDVILEKVVKKLDACEAEARKTYGDTFVDNAMANYQAFDADEGKLVDLGALCNKFDTMYADLVAAQDAAKAVIAAIATATAKVEAKAADAADAVVAAWNAVKTWNDEYKILKGLTEIVADASYVPVYGVEGEYIFDLVIAEGAVKEAHKSYVFDEAYVTTYFIPNINDLLEASIAIDAAELEDVVADIPENIIYATEAEGVDSKAAIDAADAAIKAFKAKYAEHRYYDVEAVAALEAKVADAYATYNALVDEAKAIIADINALPATNKITIADYRTGALKPAYERYIAFTKTMNSGYNGVITNEAALIEKIVAYVELEATELLEVEAEVTISKALVDRLDATDATVDTALRAEITDKANELRADVLEIEKPVLDTAKELTLIDQFNAWYEDAHAEAVAFANELLNYKK